jgi:hypothetical protein
VASSAQESALIDTLTRRVLYKGSAPIGVPSQDPHGRRRPRLLFVRGNTVPPGPGEEYSDTRGYPPGCYMLTEPCPSIWVPANRASIYRVKVPAARRK